MKKLCIAVMMKNEESIIERCLLNILKLNPDHIVVIDTMSTDASIVRASLFLNKYTIPYTIYQENFINFAHNRTLLLEKSKNTGCHYTLMVDADEVVILNKPHKLDFKENLTADIYDVAIINQSITYHLPRLTNNSKSINYIGVTHECLDENNLIKDFCPAISIISLDDSHRRTTNRKHLEDITLLEAALKTETNKNLLSRYHFYLAQAYFYTNQWDNAFIHYRQRVTMGGWDEEIFYSYYQMGNILAQYNSARNLKDALHNYFLAYDICPHRAESLCAMEKLLMQNQLMNSAKAIYKIRKGISRPASGLFIEFNAYD